MDKWYRVRAGARARGYSSSFHFFFTPKFAYVVSICNFEFSYKWPAIRAHAFRCLRKARH